VLVVQRVDLVDLRRRHVLHQHLLLTRSTGRRSEKSEEDEAHLGEPGVHERLGEAQEDVVQVVDEALGRDRARVDAHRGALGVELRRVAEEVEDGRARGWRRAHDVVEDAEERVLRALRTARGERGGERRQAASEREESERRGGRTWTPRSVPRRLALALSMLPRPIVLGSGK